MSHLPEVANRPPPAWARAIAYAVVATTVVRAWSRSVR